MTRSSDPRVAVLGCGPAGLLAAYAAECEGAVVEIFSKPMRSKIHGAQFLHEEIDGIKVPSTEVNFQFLGTPEMYAKKIYGPIADMVQTSWGKYEGSITAYSMNHLYAQLWGTYQKRINRVEYISKDFINAVEDQNYDLLVSTIPAPALCLDPDEHFFDSQKFWIFDVPEDGMPRVGGNQITYNGDWGTPWYRSSRLFGKSYIEFGDNSIHPDNCYPASKIIHTNCDCRKNWIKTGRFGAWKRGVLVHDAYWEVKNAMLKMFGSGTSRSSN